MTEIDEALGDWISQRRTAAGLSQQQLAIQVRMDQTALSRAETGHRRITVEELLRVADSLAVSEEELTELVANLRESLRSTGSIWDRRSD